MSLNFDEVRPDLIKWRALVQFTDPDKLIAIFCELLSWCEKEQNWIDIEITSIQKKLKARYAELDEYDDDLYPFEFTHPDCVKRMGRFFMYLKNAQKDCAKVIAVLVNIVGPTIPLAKRREIIGELKMKEIKELLFASGSIENTTYASMSEKLFINHNKCWNCDDKHTIDSLLK